MEQLVRYACPLCERPCDHADALRCHLHVSHRKSQIIDAYLDAVER